MNGLTLRYSFDHNNTFDIETRMIKFAFSFDCSSALCHSFVSKSVSTVSLFHDVRANVFPVVVLFLSYVFLTVSLLVFSMSTITRKHIRRSLSILWLTFWIFPSVFCSHRLTGKFIIFNLFPTFRKAFMPVKNNTSLWLRGKGCAVFSCQTSYMNSIK